MSAHIISHKAPLASWVPEGRRLVAVDIENLVGGSNTSSWAVGNALAQLRDIVGTSLHDVWIYACGPDCLRAATGALSATRVLVRGGIDGADQALLEQLDIAQVVGRYSSVVLASGDGRAFASQVRRLAQAGVPTDLVSRHRSTSQELRSFVRSFTPLTPSSFVLVA